MSEQPEDPNEVIEVTWGGKKLLIQRAKLDEWYHAKSFEEKVDFVNTHPYIRQPVGVHKFSGGKFRKDSDLMDPDDYVLVKWSGGRVLLLERNQLDEWYNSSYEKHVDFIKRHPDCELVEDKE